MNNTHELIIGFGVYIQLTTFKKIVLYSYI